MRCYPDEARSDPAQRLRGLLLGVAARMCSCLAASAERGGLGTRYPAEGGAYKGYAGRGRENGTATSGAVSDLPRIGDGGHCMFVNGSLGDQFMHR